MYVKLDMVHDLFGALPRAMGKNLARDEKWDLAV
jgi:hypothetical protein